MGKPKIAAAGEYTGTGMHFFQAHKGVMMIKAEPEAEGAEKYFTKDNKEKWFYGYPHVQGHIADIYAKNSDFGGQLYVILANKVKIQGENGLEDSIEFSAFTCSLIGSQARSLLQKLENVDFTKPVRISAESDQYKNERTQKMVDTTKVGLWQDHHTTAKERFISWKYTNTNLNGMPEGVPDINNGVPYTNYTIRCLWLFRIMNAVILPKLATVTKKPISLFNRFPETMEQFIALPNNVKPVHFKTENDVATAGAPNPQPQIQQQPAQADQSFYQTSNSPAKDSLMQAGDNSFAETNTNGNSPAKATEAADDDLPF